MNDPKIKQQIAENIRDATNILVTVSNNPSVDELSAALGLTLLLNNLDKHATAVFSGDIPPAIKFLDPERTFENTTDSLRDFIIALDKEKADHLRYKLDGDMVKIFITPYRTTISSDDLDFSQGDYNVELVVALGVENQEHLDKALESHGKILHDATVVTLSAGEQVSNLGSLDWRDENASSLSEMLVSLSEAIRSDKKLLNKSIATAFLTGIVASTERFSNVRTSSRVMTMAAQLMAAGADQQLIAAKLEESHEIPRQKQESADTKKSGNKSQKKQQNKKADDDKQASKKDDGSLVIDHQKSGDLDEVGRQTREEGLAASQRRAERELEKQAQQAEVTEQPAEAQPQSQPTDAANETPQPPAEQPTEASLRGAVDWNAKAPQEIPEPLLGGTLNATTEQAETEKKRQAEADQNKTILKHTYLGDASPSSYNSPLNGAMEDKNAEAAQKVDVFGGDKGTNTSTSQAQTLNPLPPLPQVESDPSQAQSTPASSPTPELPKPQPNPAPTAPQTLADLDAKNRAMSPNDARAAVEEALAEQSPAPQPPVATTPQPQTPVEQQPAPQASVPSSPSDSTLPPPPPLPDFSALPPPPTFGVDPTPQQDQIGDQPQILGDIFGAPQQQQAGQQPQQPAAPQPPAPADPGQFRIPGQ